jgi:hypothetical protein
MLLVIFGAGASYDSLARIPPQSGSLESQRITVAGVRLPLANELFGSRDMFLNAMARFPEMNDIVPYLQQPRNNYLEAELQHINDTAKSYPPNYSKLLAVRYYLQYIVRQCEEAWRGVTRDQTNHAVLLGEIDRWQHGSRNSVLLATFNYDHLIEEALKALAVNVDGDVHLNDYIAHPVYKLFKVHGSVNWARTLDNVEKVDKNENQWVVVQRNIKSAEHLRITNTICRDDNYPTGHINGFPAIPAIAIPIQNKNGVECPASHMVALTRELPQVQKILIIGWRGTESLFNATVAGTLRGRRSQILIACGPEAANQDTIKNLRAAGIDGEYEMYNGGFSELVVSRKITEWLSSTPKK